MRQQQSRPSSIILFLCSLFLCLHIHEDLLVHTLHPLASVSLPAVFSCIYAAVGTQQPIVLKPSVRTLLEVVCQGVLAQLEGPGWVRAQLGLTMQVCACLQMSGAIMITCDSHCQIHDPRARVLIAGAHRG